MDDHAELREQLRVLKRRVRMSNMLSVGAVVLALIGGTAYAASRYVITSTNQIMPSVLAKIERHAQGPPGAAGSAGTAGPTGAIGPQGALGAPGLNGSGTVGYSATGSTSIDGYPSMGTYPEQPGPASTIVSRQLPAGDFVASASVNLLAFELQGGSVNGVAQPSNIDLTITCLLTDTPDSGSATTDYAAWSVIPEDYEPSEISYADDTMSLNEAISSPTSASTLAVTCQTASLYPTPANSSTIANSTASANAAETAVQTTANN